MKYSMEFQIPLIIKDINSKINQKITESLKATGLTVPQITAIKLIAHHKELTVSQLSEEMCLTKATVSGILDRLENLNIVERTRSNEDKRVVYVKFSEQGSKTAYEIKDLMNSCFDNIFNGVNEEQLNNIYKGLIELSKLVDEGLLK